MSNSNKLIILGSGAAPGVPSLSNGWGNCNPNNPKNVRLRTGTYIELNGAKFLIDTSPDLRQQLLTHNIRELDAVFYTHAHADHMNGIDDLREINRITNKGLHIYGDKPTIKTIKKRFEYLVTDAKHADFITGKPSIIPHIIKPNRPFYIKGVKITALKLKGHPGSSVGYAFNDGELVLVGDFKELASSAIKRLAKQPKIMIMPLTTIYPHPHHAGLEKLLEYEALLKPEKLVINHMSTNCDYDEINKKTPDHVSPAFDNLVLEF